MNTANQAKPPRRPKAHLFSPHTDQCVYCGKSAQDDAIENTPCSGGRSEPPTTPNPKGSATKRKTRWTFCVYSRQWEPVSRNAKRCPRCGAALDRGTHPVQESESNPNQKA